jgi:hypothetical protein
MAVLGFILAAFVGVPLFLFIVFGILLNGELWALLFKAVAVVATIIIIALTAPVSIPLILFMGTRK